MLFARLALRCSRSFGSLGLSVILVAASALTVAVAFPGRAWSVPSAAQVLQNAESQALTAAARTKTRVEVAGSRSEAARTYATPDGSLVREVYAVPRWTSTADGG